MITCQRSRFCLVPRRLSLEVNFREVPACASSPATCVSRSPLFKTKVRNSTRLRRQDCSRVSSINQRVDLVLPATEHFDAQPQPLPYICFQVWWKDVIAGHTFGKEITIYLFTSTKRTNTPPPPTPAPQGTERAEPRESFLAVLTLKLQEATMVVNA